MRRSDARHHPVALVMLGTLFLIWQKTNGHQRWPTQSFNDLVTAKTRLLPRRRLAAEELAPVIEKRHRQRLQAEKSRRRRSAVVLD